MSDSALLRTANRERQRTDSRVPSIRRVARFASPVALALNELRDVARHLSEKDAHRDVGEGEREREGQRESDEHGQERQDG